MATRALRPDPGGHRRQAGVQRGAALRPPARAFGPRACGPAGWANGVVLAYLGDGGELNPSGDPCVSVPSGGVGLLGRRVIQARPLCWPLFRPGTFFGSGISKTIEIRLAVEPPSLPNEF